MSDSLWGVQCVDDGRSNACACGEIRTVREARDAYQQAIDMPWWRVMHRDNPEAPWQVGPPPASDLKLFRRSGP